MAKKKAAKKSKSKLATKKKTSTRKPSTSKRVPVRKSAAAVIKGVHAMFYSSEPDALRGFLRDKLRLPFTDVGQGWLIFDLPEADMGCHPSDTDQGGMPTGTHHISFYCDDIQKSVAELKARGVEFTHEIADHGYGLVTLFKMPGGFDVQLYQPKYLKG
jgi:hypothetical protein